MKRLFAPLPSSRCVAGAAFAQQQPSPVQPAPVKRTLLGKVEVPGANYDVVTAMVEIAPGFKAGRHNHPGTVQAQVLDGEFWLALDGQPEKACQGRRVARNPQQRDPQRGRGGLDAGQADRHLYGGARQAAWSRRRRDHADLLHRPRHRRRPRASGRHSMHGTATSICPTR